VALRRIRFRTTSTTFGIIDDEEHRGTLVIPAGAVFSVIEEPTDGDRLVDIFWEGRRLLMFTQDLRLRAERLSDTATEDGR
jgi:hypothetical protein